MNVLSLFDGMSCGQQALERSGIKVDNYFASEIDKYAIKVTQHNYPNTVQLGSVVDVDVSTLPHIDLLIGGSPCQSFSFAGKRKGMTTKCEEEILSLDKYLKLKEEGYEFEGQSYLFWEYMRVLTDIRKYNPNVKFLLENVVMSEKWEKVLTKAIGVNPIKINSALVSAQNRERLYWTNIGMIPMGLFGDLESIIQQPKDKGLLLKDILQDNPNAKFYLTNKATDYVLDSERIDKKHTQVDGDKALCLTSRYGNGTGQHIEVDEKYYLSDKLIHTLFETRSGSSGQFKEAETKDVNDKGNSLTSRYFKMGRQDNYICAASRGRNPESPKSRKSGLPTEQHLETREDGKTNCLTSVQKDNLVIQLNTSTESGGKQPYQQNRVYDTEGISPDLMAQMSCGSHAIMERVGGVSVTERGIRPHQGDEKKSGISELGTIIFDDQKTDSLTTSHVTKFIEQDVTSGTLRTHKDGEGFREVKSGKGATIPARAREDGSGQNVVNIRGRIRRLTPIECERLQTVVDGYTSVVSDTQRYKMLGNGWTIDVIAHIFSYL